MITQIYIASALFTFLFLLKNIKIYRKEWEIVNRLEKEKNGGENISSFWLYVIVLVVTPAIWPIYWFLVFTNKDETDDE